MRTIARAAGRAAPLLAVAMLSCDDGPAAPEPASLSVSPASVTLESLGDTAAFSAVVTDQYGDAFPGTVRWRGSQPTVFSVTQGGVVRAAGNGSGMVTASFEDLSATANVTVAQVAASLDVAAGGGQAVRQGLALREPVVVQVNDAGGSPVEDVEVVFAPADGDGSVEPGAATTGADGRARTTWTLGDRPGPQTLMASVAGAGEPSALATATALTPEEAADSVRVVAGGQQSVLQGRALPEPVVAVVLDDAGEPVPGARVAFAPAEGDGTADPDTAATGADGRAQTTWTLGDRPGPQSLTASVVIANGPSAQAAATALTPEEVADSIRIVAGAGQSGLQGRALPEPVVAVVLDDAGEPVPGARVAFAPADGDGAADPDTATTSADGRAQTTWTLGDHAGTQSLAAAVVIAGGPTAQTTATALRPEEAVATVRIVSGDQQSGFPGERLSAPVVVEALDAAGDPVPNAEVSFTPASGHGRADPASAATTAQGRAQTHWTLGDGLGTQRLAVATGRVSVDAAATARRRPVNTPPEASAAIPTLVLQVGGPTVEVLGGSHFSDADDDALQYSATSSDDRTVRASVQGDRIAIQPVSRGTVRLVVTAADPSGATASQAVWAAVLPTPSNSSYDIDLLDFSGSAHRLPQAALAADKRWEEIVVGDIGNIAFSGQTYDACRQRFAVAAELDDLVVFVYVTDIDGQGNTLARAGPCLWRRNSNLPAFGFIEFDAADLGSSSLDVIALHEVGHVLGIGTLWSVFGFLQNPSSESDPEADTHFTGPAARAAFDAAGGTGYTSGAKVPVESNNHAGNNSHWRNEVFRPELMGPYLYGDSSSPLSAVTIQSLADLGYSVDASQADSWSLASSAFDLAAALRRGDVVSLEHDVVRGPALVVDEAGRVVRVIRD